MPRKETIETSEELLEEIKQTDTQEDQKTLLIAKQEETIKQLKKSHSDFLQRIIQCIKDNTDSNFDKITVDLEDDDHIYNFVEEIVRNWGKAVRELEDEKQFSQKKITENKKIFDAAMEDLYILAAGQGTKITSLEELKGKISELLKREDIDYDQQKKFEERILDMTKAHAEEIEEIKRGYEAKLSELNLQLDTLRTQLAKAEEENKKQASTIAELKTQVNQVLGAHAVVTESIKHIEPEATEKVLKEIVEEQEEEQHSLKRNLWYRLQILLKLRKVYY